MPEQESIEDLLAKELRSLCINCATSDTCACRSHSINIIIQCTLHELAEDGPARGQQEPHTLKGLCMNCCHAATCRLPDKQSGAWRCEEYE